MGDILQVSCSTRPQRDFTHSHQLVPLPEVTSLPSYPPYVLLGGPATNVNKSTATWHMPISQYAFNTRDASLPVIARIPDSPRYANGKKPIPSDLNLITAAGPLTEIRYTEDRSVANVSVAVDHIVFHGRTQAILPSSSSDTSSEYSYVPSSLSLYSLCVPSVAKSPEKRRVRVSPKRSLPPTDSQSSDPVTPPRPTKKSRTEKNN